MVERVELEVEQRFFDEIDRRKNSPGEIVMVVRRPSGAVLTITKEFYPQGTYRIPTGKMKQGESVETGYARELREETGFANTPAKLACEIHYTIRSGELSTTYVSFLMLTEPTDARPIPIDEDEQITAFREATTADLLSLADQLRAMEHPWRDWGRYRAIAHEVVARLLVVHSQS